MKCVLFFWVLVTVSCSDQNKPTDTNKRSTFDAAAIESDDILEKATQPVLQPSPQSVEDPVDLQEEPQQPLVEPQPEIVNGDSLDGASELQPAPPKRKVQAITEVTDSEVAPELNLAAPDASQAEDKCSDGLHHDAANDLCLETEKSCRIHAAYLVNGTCKKSIESCAESGLAFFEDSKICYPCEEGQELDSEKGVCTQLCADGDDGCAEEQVLCQDPGYISLDNVCTATEESCLNSHGRALETNDTGHSYCVDNEAFCASFNMELVDGQCENTVETCNVNQLYLNSSKDCVSNTELTSQECKTYSLHYSNSLKGCFSASESICQEIGYDFSDASGVGKCVILSESTCTNLNKHWNSKLNSCFDDLETLNAELAALLTHEKSQCNENSIITHTTSFDFVKYSEATGCKTYPKALVKSLFEPYAPPYNIPTKVEIIYEFLGRKQIALIKNGAMWVPANGTIVVKWSTQFVSYCSHVYMLPNYFYSLDEHTASAGKFNAEIPASLTGASIYAPDYTRLSSPGIIGFFEGLFNISQTTSPPPLFGTYTWAFCAGVNPTVH